MNVITLDRAMNVMSTNLDNQDTPRGRIFYDVKNDLFVIKVGSWIYNYSTIEQLIIDEFNLTGQKYKFEIDGHW